MSIENSDTVPSAEDQAQRLERASDHMADLLRRPEVAQRVRTAGPDEWSAVQVIGHVIELVPYWMGQMQMLVSAEGAPPSFGRGLDAVERLEGVAHGAASDPEALLRQMEEAVQAGAAGIRAMTTEQRAKKGVHNRRGEATVAEFIEALLVAHVEDHLAQIEQALGGPG
jgi:hypothetical protein